MPSNDFTDMEFKPVVIPEWKERNIATFSEPEQPTGMQVLQAFFGGRAFFGWVGGVYYHRLGGRGLLS